MKAIDDLRLITRGGTARACTTTARVPPRAQRAVVLLEQHDQPQTSSLPRDVSVLLYLLDEGSGCDLMAPACASGSIHKIKGFNKKNVIS